MNELELKLTVDEANLILDALGNLPFKQVYELVGKLQDQASSQLNSSLESPGQDEANEQNG